MYLHKNAYSSIVNCRIRMCTLEERAWHPQQENEAIILKNYFEKILRDIEKLCSCLLLLLLAVEEYFEYQVKGIYVLYQKIKCYIQKI